MEWPSSTSTICAESRRAEFTQVRAKGLGFRVFRGLGFQLDFYSGLGKRFADGVSSLLRSRVAFLGGSCQDPHSSFFMLGSPYSLLRFLFM